MKLKICFPALLCLFFLTRAGFGQGIKIGDKVPDVLIGNVKGLRLNGRLLDGSGAAAGASVRLSAFRGKLLVLDFWATWCAPCRKMVPVMDSLQRVFGDKVVFLPVTYESEAVVRPVLSAMQRVRPFSLPEVTSDVVLGKLFPHRSLPHYVWVSPEGVLLAVTEEKAVTGENIQKFLSGGSAVLAVKRDSVSRYDPGLPLLVNGNGGDASGLRYHSLLSGYKAGLAGGVSVSRYDSVSGQRFTARNVPFPWLCRLAFGENGRVFPRSRTLVLTADSLAMDTRLSGQAYEDWLASGRGWCYELLLPPGIQAGAFGMMQADLSRLFPAYQVSVERRALPCLALVRTSASDKLRSAGGELSVAVSPYSAELRNAHLSQLMMRLERQYLQNSTLPVVDATGYTGRVDLRLTAQLYNVEDLNRALEAYDLRFVKRDTEVEVLVIRDAAGGPVMNSLKPKS